MRKIRAEYIWLDGQLTAKLRSKTKIIGIGDTSYAKLEDVPEWGFDGSSTYQANTNKSDCVLKPIKVILDPLRNKTLGEGRNILVLCEVFLEDGKTPHWSNTRAKLREVAEKHKEAEPWFGIEQEYTLFDKDGGRPLRWPYIQTNYPGPQGSYYCGIGADEVYGQQIIEKHTEACLNAGLEIAGTNAEVMPAQWEFQVGPLGPLEVSDSLWLMRWLLYKVAETMDASVKLHPKPIAGDWNGAGAHTNFSTKATRGKDGIKAIYDACEKLKKFHKQHIAVYGADNNLRLTGRHETSGIDEFTRGVSDRGASVRIPLVTANNNSGYLEDRRPAANIDPYKVCTALIETICGDGFEPPEKWVEITI